jgi:hypothetical protein
MVRVTYSFDVWRALRASPYPNHVRLRGQPRARQLVAQLGRGEPGGGGFAAASSTVCCDLQPGREMVDFGGCARRDLFAVNYTAAALAALAGGGA